MGMKLVNSIFFSCDIIICVLFAFGAARAVGNVNKDVLATGAIRLAVLTTGNTAEQYGWLRELYGWLRELYGWQCWLRELYGWQC